jgi:hypothetical protein
VKKVEKEKEELKSENDKLLYCTDYTRIQELEVFYNKDFMFNFKN